MPPPPVPKKKKKKKRVQPLSPPPDLAAESAARTRAYANCEDVAPLPEEDGWTATTAPQLNNPACVADGAAIRLLAGDCLTVYTDASTAKMVMLTGDLITTRSELSVMMVDSVDLRRFTRKDRRRSVAKPETQTSLTMDWPIEGGLPKGVPPPAWSGPKPRPAVYFVTSGWY